MKRMINCGTEAPRQGHILCGGREEGKGRTHEADGRPDVAAGEDEAEDGPQLPRRDKAADGVHARLDDLGLVDRAAVLERGQLGVGAQVRRDRLGLEATVRTTEPR